MQWNKILLCVSARVLSQTVNTKTQGNLIRIHNSFYLENASSDSLLLYYVKQATIRVDSEC